MDLDSLQAAEYSVVGALLLQPSCGLDLDVSPEHFVTSDVREVFQAVQGLQAAAEPIDVLTVADRLERTTGRAWLAYVGRIVRETPSAANVKSYATILRDEYRRRKASEIGQRLIANPDDMDAVIRDLMAVSASRKTFEVSGDKAYSRAMEIADDATHGVTGAPSGLGDLDRCLGGFHRGDLIVIGARPGQGKTAFMVNLAVKGKSRAGIISAEQGHEQIGMRMAAIEARVSVHRMRIGTTSAEEYQRMADAQGTPINGMLWINDQPAISIDEIQRVARRWKFERKIETLYVDYLQRLKCSNVKAPRREQVGEIVRTLKELARELDIPVIVLAQLSREVERRGGGRPQISDLAESADIEREADQILLLHRDEESTTLEVFVGKNRHGPGGKIEMHWVPDCMAIDTVERRY